MTTLTTSEIQALRTKMGLQHYDLINSARRFRVLAEMAATDTDSERAIEAAKGMETAAADVKARFLALTGLSLLPSDAERAQTLPDDVGTTVPGPQSE